MPPKKTDKTVAATQLVKCTRCLKRHAAPLHNACLALVAEGGKDLIDVVDNGEVEGEADLVHDGEDLNGEANQTGIMTVPEVTPSGQVPSTHTGTDDLVALQ
jgi:hypothetical protein